MDTRMMAVKALQKLHLNRIAHKVYYNMFHGFDTANRPVLDAIERCIHQVMKDGVAAQGDYYEFGLFKGYAFWHAQKTGDRMGLHDWNYFGFDSFQGLPEVTGVDRSPNDEFYAGQYACSQEQVMSSLEEAGVDWERTHLIPGFYEHSLTSEACKEHGMGRVALALIDCDLYASTQEVLRFLTPMLVDGSILMMDDWNCYDAAEDKGQRRAAHEWMKTQQRFSLAPLFPYGSWGQVFRVHRAASGASH